MKSSENRFRPQLVRACSVVIGLAAANLASAETGSSWMDGIDSAGPSKSSTFQGLDLDRVGSGLEIGPKLSGNASMAINVTGRGGSGPRVSPVPPFPQIAPFNDVAVPQDASAAIADAGVFDGGGGGESAGGPSAGAIPVVPSPVSALGIGAILGARVLTRRR